MSGYLIASLPWLAGGLLCLALLGSQRDVQYAEGNPLERKAPPPEFLCGLGGLLGYLVWGYGLWVADQFGYTLLSSYSIIFLAFLVALAAIPAHQNTVRIPVQQRFSLIDWLLVGLLSALCGLALYLQHATPLFAWDGLDYWAKNAVLFIQHNLTEESSAFIGHDIKHPTTVVMIAAWSGWSMQLTNAVGCGTPWLLCMVSLCLMAAGFIRALTGERTLALLGGVLVATVPLAESHALIVGYAELWLTAVVIAGLMLCGLGLQYQKKSLILAGLLMGALAMTIKNTGPGYALCVWGALASSWLARRPKIAAMVLTPLVAATYGLYASGFLIEWAGIKIQWIPATDKLLFAGRLMPVRIWPIEQVSINELYSLLLNQSFSTAALALLFVFVAMTCFDKRAPHELPDPTVVVTSVSPSRSTIGAQPLIMGAMLILTMLILSQLFLEVGYQYSLPGADTGNSRFSLPFVLSVIPAAIVIVHGAKNKSRV